MTIEEALEREQHSASLSGDLKTDPMPKGRQRPKAGPSKRLAPVTSVALVYAKGQVVFRQTNRANAIYQVVSGAVVLSRQEEGRQRDVLEVLGPGSILGTVAGSHYGCQAEALTRTTLRRIDRNGAERSAGLQRIIAQALMRQVEKMRDETNLRMQRSATERVAALILSLPCIEVDGDDAGHEDHRASLSQTDMASYLGLALETVCRVMRDLKRKEVIRASGRECIAILDRSALSSAANQAPALAREYRRAAAG